MDCFVHAHRSLIFSLRSYLSSPRPNGLRPKVQGIAIMRKGDPVAQCWDISIYLISVLENIDTDDRKNVNMTEIDK